MNEFMNSLIPINLTAEQKNKLNLFGQFVGEWEFNWIDGKGTQNERQVPGEWIFSYILDGQGVQDVFICPSREERMTNIQPDSEYGTTIRILNDDNTWNICYTCKNKMVFLIVKEFGEQIILENLDQTCGLNQWVFSDITENSFHWQNKTLLDNLTWRINGELFAKRK